MPSSKLFFLPKNKENENDLHLHSFYVIMILKMYICLCNPFNDKKVREHLEKTQGRASVSDTYIACSNGEKPQCCSCLETLKDIVHTHNHKNKVLV